MKYKTVVWTLMVIFISVSVNAVLNDKIVSYYNFEEGSGTLITDIIGSNNGNMTDATYNTTIRRNGVYGARLAGNDKFLLINYTTTQVSEIKSVCVWVYDDLSSANPSRNVRFLIGDGDGRVNLGISYQTRNIYWFDPFNLGWIDTGYDIAFRNWSFICVNMHNNLNNYTVYLNGTTILSGANFSYHSDRNHTIEIGTAFYNADSYFYVDELSMFTTNLSVKDIQYMYQQGKGYYYPWMESELNDCTSNGTKTINFTVKNETTTTDLINTDIDITFNYFVSSPSLYIKNFSISSTNDSSIELCIYPNGTSFISDFQVEYTYNNIYYSYFQQDINLSNVTKYYNLFITSGTTIVTFNVKSTDDDDIENAYITVEKYDVGSDTYKPVEVLKTDAQGNALGNIILNTAWYKFTITYDGIVYLVSGPSKIITTTYNFRIDLTGGDWFDSYDNYKGVNFNLTFTNATKNFNLQYNDPNQVISKACLEVKQINITGTRSLNDTCLTTYSGTILTNIGTNVIDNTYIATAYLLINGNIIVIDTLALDYLTEWKFYEENDNGYGVFVTLIVVIALVMVGLFNPMIAIALTILAFIVMKLLGLYYISLPMIITLTIIGVVTIFKVTKNR